MPFKFAVNQNPLTIEFEAGSIKEGIGILQDEATALSDFFATAAKLAQGGGEAPAESPTAVDPAKDKPRRGRPAKDASAPPPAPVPGAVAPVPPAPAAAPATPVPPAPAGDGLAIPGFLQRTATPPVPPPTPAAPPPPAAAPAAPKLAHKVIDELKKRAEASADQGQALAGWIAQCGLVNNTTPPPTLTEVIEVVQFLDDSKVAGVAAQLGVA